MSLWYESNARSECAVDNKRMRRTRHVLHSHYRPSEWTYASKAMNKRHKSILRKVWWRVALNPRAKLQQRVRVALLDDIEQSESGLLYESFLHLMPWTSASGKLTRRRRVDGTWLLCGRILVHI